MGRTDDPRETARQLIARHGQEALPLAVAEVRKRLAAGQYRSLLAWTRVALLVAIMLDNTGQARERTGPDELARVLDGVTRRLRAAGH